MDIRTITLAYAFFNTVDSKAAAKTLASH